MIGKDDKWGFAVTLVIVLLMGGMYWWVRVSNRPTEFERWKAVYNQSRNADVRVAALAEMAKCAKNHDEVGYVFNIARARNDQKLEIEMAYKKKELFQQKEGPNRFLQFLKNNDYEQYFPSLYCQEIWEALQVVATLPEVEETVYFIDQGQDCNIERLRGEYQTARARVLATELAEFLQKPDPDRLNYLWQAFPEGGEERGEILLVAKKYLNTSFVELKAVREILPSNEEKAAYLQKMRGKAHEYVEWESVFHICAQEGNEACRDEALGHMKSLVPVRGEEED